MISVRIFCSTTCMTSAVVVVLKHIIHKLLVDSTLCGRDLRPKHLIHEVNSNEINVFFLICQRQLVNYKLDI